MKILDYVYWHNENDQLCQKFDFGAVDVLVIDGEVSKITIDNINFSPISKQETDEILNRFLKSKIQ